MEDGQGAAKPQPWRCLAPPAGWGCMSLCLHIVLVTGCCSITLALKLILKLSEPGFAVQTESETQAIHSNGTR